jgi:hypothetical protein
MRCSDFESRWNEILDRRESPESDPRLQAHRARCATCRERYAGFETACETLGLQFTGTLGESRRFSQTLAERVLADLSAAPLAADRAAPRPPLAGRIAVARGIGLPGPRHPQRRNPHRRPTTAVLGLAAATLIAVYLSGMFSARPRLPVAPGRPSPAAVSSGIPIVSLPVAVKPAPPDRQPAAAMSVGVARSDLPSPNRELAHGTSQGLALVLNIPDVAVELASTSRPDYAAANEAWSTVSESLRPVTASMSETWQILKRAIPAIEPPHG